MRNGEAASPQSAIAISVIFTSTLGTFSPSCTA